MNLYILPLIAQIGVWGWVVIALAILLLFGGKKIPELMRGTGKGIKEFKKGLNEGLDEDLKEQSNLLRVFDNKNVRRDRILI